MRVVSLVPSWTETLIEAGVDVVGRTRFCIHPADRARTIPAVGGTKDINLEKIKALKPDLIILDREENTRAMADALALIAPLHVTHVESARDLPRELRALAAALGNASSTMSKTASTPHADRVASASASQLESFADRFESVIAIRSNHFAHEFASRPDSFSADVSIGPTSPRPFAYVIWKDPWMCVSRETFIASMLELSGFDLQMLWASEGGKYPQFELAQLPDRAHLLLSSEPFPFAKKEAEVSKLLASPELASKHLTYELIDGESFSWFGIRALLFLESLRSGA